MKFKVGDTVLVTAGKDKGRKGTIERAWPKTSRILVKGVNLYKRHVKGKEGQRGGIITLERSLSVAQVAIICPACQKPTRINYQLGKAGRKQRICNKCQGGLT